MNTITVLGEGAFGTAISCLLADCGVDVKLWCHDTTVAQQICTTRMNTRYLHDVYVVDSITPVHELSQALDGAAVIFVTTPVKFLRHVLEKSAAHYRPEQLWVFLCKGIETETLMLPTHIAEDVFGSDCRTATIMGPSFAKELARKQPTQVDVAAKSEADAQFLHDLLITPYFKTTMVDDMVGMQICAAYKNVIALGAGILHGAGYGDNTRALLLTKGLYEMGILTVAIGGSQETVFGLAGLGDLILTASSMQSRNVIVGTHIGAGTTLEHVLQKTGAIPEGVTTVQALHILSQETEIVLPLCNAIHEIIYNHQTIDVLIQQLG